ncbi:MAG: DUF429 domain-containing protein [Burkholderiales bacterium]|nr:MAG: hypothetical protein CBB82_07370 [Betaproteobacteria bacterium TMED22]|tara:strand:- start:2500 stop:3183 length:684 start_codon:yes stop_codon:yes gene_type:complete
MSVIVGIDGCKSGWFVIWEESDNTLRSCVIPQLKMLRDMISFRHLTIGIDIPVVLSDEIPRAADQLARKQLGKKSSTIFTAPTPGILKQTNYEQACHVSKNQFGKSISIQSWNLFPKIRDAQTLADEEQIDIFEIHPELSFRALNRGNVILESKKIAKGFLLRSQLLERAFPNFEFEAIRAQYLKKDVANDDILDALVVLWSVKRVIAKEAIFLPDNPIKPNMSIAY